MMVKKIYLISLIAALFQNPVQAQDNKITTVLAQMPANNTKAFNNNAGSIANLGEDGYATLIEGLTAPDKGNNSSIEYAVGGFTAYVSQTGKEDLRKMSVNAYAKALQKLTDKQNKSFIISQFDIVGKDDAITYLLPYLTDNDLADPAARALAKINTPASKKALLNALDKANGNAKLFIIEALGDSRCKEAAASLNKLAAGSDAAITKVVLYALAYIADPSSEPVMAAVAQKNGFKYENTNATKSYLIYAEELAKTGNAALTKKIANNLISKPGIPENVRVSALQLLVKTTADPTQLLLNASGDADPKYRCAALKLALPSLSTANANLWVKKLSTSNNDVKSDILYMLSQSTAKSALPAILELAKSKDAKVKQAAINAAVNIGQENVLGSFIKLMDQGSSDDIDMLTEAISHMKGATVTAQVAAAIPTAKQSVQVALLGILDTRAANAQINTVFDQLKSKNPRTSHAAYAALAHVAAKENAPKLFTLLDETGESEQEAVQDAIIAALSGKGYHTQEVDMTLQQMASAPENKKFLFYKILGSLGNDKALKVVTTGYNSGNAETKKEALKALAAWPNAGAASELITIARDTKDETEQSSALYGYLRIAEQGDNTAEQEYLLLRNAMSVAQTPEQKKQILKDMAKAECFNTLIFAGKYLDNHDLQQQAARTVINVALAGEYNGDVIKTLLNKTIQVITGRDSEKQKETLRKYIADMKPGEGFVSVFNGTDLTGWKGLVADPIKRAAMDAKTLAAEQQKADAEAKVDWKPVNGELLFEGKGFQNLCTVKKYGDFEMYVDWKIIDDHKGEGDAGIYLRGSPQVQIWDTSRRNAGAQVGSGGLYNNQVNESKPLKVADNKLGEWNTFHIIMKGDRVTVYLNGELVTDNIILENYWDRKIPIFAQEQIELQAHGSPVAYRDIYIKELPSEKPYELSKQEQKEGYKVLFDGTNMFNWTGNTVDYTIDSGTIAIHPRPGKGSGGNLYTKEEFSDFEFRFEFKLTHGANNGLGIRAPLEGDAAYVGMELQILDNEDPMYKDLHVYQYHGSIYGTIPAKRGYLKPVGEWNYEDVIVKGPKIKVILNGTTILDADITEARKNGAADGKPHPGLQRDSGHIGFLGHGDVVYFKNIRVKDLSKKK